MILRHVILAAAYVFTLVLIITPPGVCPCWLMFDPADHHPHFDGHPEVPHDHRYLLEYFQSQTIESPPVATIPVALLIAHQAASGLVHTIPGQMLVHFGWDPDPQVPPPRLLSAV